MQGATLRYPPGSLVILTGLPGAGKTTLLRRLYGLHGAENVPVPAGPAVVIDSGQSRLRWDGRITWAPRAVRRAVVFATHVGRISRALALGRAVVAHNRGCGPYVLTGFAWLARRQGASFHLLLLDAPPEEALAGQHARGRVVAPRTFARHRRHWESLLARVKDGDPAPAASARVVTRAEAGLLEHIVFDSADSADHADRTDHAPAD
ncbi:MAG: AAA family ATPase [Nonomuraea sp.]|nr:AAA family ATPase [Nonomuraea sp.]